MAKLLLVVAFACLMGLAVAQYSSSSSDSLNSDSTFYGQVQVGSYSETQLYQHINV